MRVGFFTEVYRPVVNGIVASIDALAGGLRLRGHDVHFFTPRVPGHESDGHTIYELPSLPLPTQTAYRLTLPLVSRRFINRVVKHLDIIHAHSPFVTGWMAMRYARRFSIPFVYTYHTRLEEYAHYVPFEPHATRLAAETLTRGFANSADAVIVPTLAMRERLRELGVEANIDVIPTGIDLRRFSAGERSETLRGRLRVKNGGRLLLFVSRLAKEKNVELLLEALAATNDDRFVLAIAGDGPQREELERYAAELHVSARVRFLGSIARESLPELYASADAFVFPSVSETQGIVLAEALAAGAPVIAAENGQNRDVLGDAGMLVPPNAAAFAQAFHTVSATQLPAQRALAKSAALRFGVDEQTERVLAVYSRLRPLPANALA
ncbi:MAG: glycosyltransferase [Candidatus Eremiobacteraeota bacterium]|nr:glycosyltransferase [Candidatus Eremiobacteraeota bacterium]